MIQVPTPSLPSSVLEWISLGSVTVGFLFAGWRSYVALVTKINGVGDRLNTQEKGAAAMHERLEVIGRTQEISSVASGAVRDRVSTTEARVEAALEELRESRLEVMSTLHAGERAAGERSSRIETQLARLEERIRLNSET